MNHDKDLEACNAATDVPPPTEPASEESQELAAQVWCTQETSSIQFDPVLCMAFARVLDGQLIEKAQRVEELEEGLSRIAAIEDNLEGGDWDEIEEARNIAKELLK